MNQFTQHRALHAACFALAVAGSFTLASAKDARSSFTVGAIVRAVADIEFQSAPTALIVSADDLKLGFIDVAQPTQLVVRSNSQSGFALELLTVTPMLSSMVVHGLDSDSSLGAEGGTLVQRWGSPRVVNLSLKFRLVLAPGLSAGSYPWPVRLAVRPLESI